MIREQYVARLDPALDPTLLPQLEASCFMDADHAPRFQVRVPDLEEPVERVIIDRAPREPRVPHLEKIGKRHEGVVCSSRRQLSENVQPRGIGAVLLEQRAEGERVRLWPLRRAVPVEDAREVVLPAVATEAVVAEVSSPVDEHSVVPPRLSDALEEQERAVNTAVRVDESLLRKTDDREEFNVLEEQPPEPNKRLLLGIEDAGRQDKPCHAADSKRRDDGLHERQGPIEGATVAVGPVGRFDPSEVRFLALVTGERWIGEYRIERTVGDGVPPVALCGHVHAHRVTEDAIKLQAITLQHVPRVDPVEQEVHLGGPHHPRVEVIAEELDVAVTAPPYAERPAATQRCHMRDRAPCPSSRRASERQSQRWCGA